MIRRLEPFLYALCGALIVAVTYGRVDASYIPVPSGAILHFNATSCPSGWSEFTTARGNVIVGRVSGGTLNTQVGTPFSDLENRTHTHSVPGLSIPSLQLFDNSSLAWQAGSIGLTNTGGALGFFDGSSFFAPSVSSTSKATNPGGTGTGTTGTGTSGTANGVVPYIELLTCQKQ